MGLQGMGQQPSRQAGTTCSAPDSRCWGGLGLGRSPGAGDGSLQILGIKGTRNQNKIKSRRLAGKSIPGNTTQEGDHRSIDLKPTGQPQLNANGFQIKLENGSCSNTGFASFSPHLTQSEFPLTITVGRQLRSQQRNHGYIQSVNRVPIASPAVSIGASNSVDHQPPEGLFA